MQKLLAALLLVLSFVACRTPAVKVDFENTKLVALSQKEAAAAVLSWCAANNGSIKQQSESTITIELADLKTLQTIVPNATPYGEATTPCADCGAISGRKYPLLRGNMSVFLMPENATTTKVTVNITYTGLDTFANVEIPCFSNGRVEGLIFRALKAREQ